MKLKHTFSKLFNLEIIAFLLLFIGSMIAVYYPLYVHIRQTPPGTTYTFAEGYLPDYYQYLGWIKDGMMGNILVSSRYTQIEYPKSLVHALFPLTGIVGDFFGKPSFSSYTVVRFLSNIIFLFAYVYLARRFLPSKVERILAYLFLLVTTGVWSQDQSGNFLEAVPWSGNFNVVGKFFLPPHHLLSLTSLMVAAVIFTKPQINKKNFVIGLMMIIIGGLLNPGHLLLFFIYLAFSCLTQPLRIFALLGNRRYTLGTALVSGVGLGLILYNSYLFQTTMPWSRMYALMRGFNPPVTFASYLFALGPILIPAIFAFTKSEIRNSKLGLFLIAWAFLPLIMFHFLDRPLPMNASRLFQSYQFIPLALLASIGTSQIAKVLQKIKIPPTLTGAIIIFVFAWYAVTPLFKGMASIIGSVKPWYFNYYVPAHVVRTFHILDSKTPKESVVLASEAVSTMIPAFTHNRVLMGRDDVASDYYEKRDKAFAMLDGRYSQEEAREFLKKYNVSFILFGLDAYQFQDTKNTTLPFLKEFYSDGGITVVSVDTSRL